MQPGTEPDRFEERSVAFSERIVLGCERCGEKLVLLGLEDDWRASGHGVFECECGAELSFANRADEEALLVKDLLRSIKVPHMKEIPGTAAPTRPRTQTTRPRRAPGR